MRAAILLRPMEHYKRSSFARGLARHGYRATDRSERSPSPDDLVLIWNRPRAFEAFAQLYERRGARVVIAENGYTVHPGKGKFYALALGFHNGAGRWLVGDRPRHRIAEEPWRTSGSRVLVLPQRGIGSPGVAMPSGWLKGVTDRLKGMTDREIVLRHHPGHRRSNPLSLEEQLAGAHCAVTWGSGAGIKAMQLGIPVFHEFSRWIGSPGAARLDGQIEACKMADRELLWTRISWAQWTLEEIESGEAFDGLLNAPAGDLFCAGQQSLDADRDRDGSWSPGSRDSCAAPAVDQLQGLAD